MNHSKQMRSPSARWSVGNPSTNQPSAPPPSQDRSYSSSLTQPQGYELSQPHWGPLPAPNRQPFGLPLQHPNRQPFGSPLQHPNRQPFGSPLQHPNRQPFGSPLQHPNRQPFGSPLQHPNRQPFGSPLQHPNRQPFGSPLQHPNRQPFGSPLQHPNRQPFGSPLQHPNRQPFGPPLQHPNWRPFGPPLQHPNRQPFSTGQLQPGQPGVFIVEPVLQNHQAGPVNDYVCYSIFTMLFCFLPLGIAALVSSIATRNAIAIRDWQMAEQSSRRALMLNHIALGMGILVAIINVVIVIMYII